MEYSELIDLLLNSIQIVGIFTAIVVGLVVSKIISLKTEQNELESKISDIDKELLVINNQLNKKKEENYNYYKENTVYDILDAIFEKKEKYNYLSDNIPFVENEYKKSFCNHIYDILKKAYEAFRENSMSLEDFKIKNNIEKDSIEELAIDEFYERGDF